MTIRLAIIDDAEVVVRGLVEMLRPFAGEVQVHPVDSRLPLEAEVDIALYDAFAPVGTDAIGLERLVAHPRVRRVVVYTWDHERSSAEDALRRGAAAYVSKTVGARELVAALKRVHAGERVPGLVDGRPGASADGRADRGNGAPAPSASRSEGSWPGREAGLTAREAEVIALITQGLSNQEIADRASLSINSVKSYIRTSYRKMGVTSRTNAVLWGLDHGFGAGRGPRPSRPGSDDGLN